MSAAVTGTPEQRAEYRQTRARIAGLTRHQPGSPELDTARARLEELKAIINAGKRDIAAARIEDYVGRMVAQAPPLTDEQRDRIAALLGR